MSQTTGFSHSDARFKDVIATPQVLSHLLKDDGTYPNNEVVPLIVYQGALTLPERQPAVIFEELFAANHWGGSWRNGVYSFHHYHSKAHEVLGVYGGTAKVQLGGPQGIVISAKKGDVIIIPAGVAHKNLGSSHDFRIVGAYPRGQSPDMCYGKSGERPDADHNIMQVAVPAFDPIYGVYGALNNSWDIQG
jgi:uncharacterized protein YjlB